MRQLRPETGDTLCKKYQITNPVVLVLFIPLLFDLLNQRGYQSKCIWNINFRGVSL